MAQTTIIEAAKRILKINDGNPHKVCAYCRVSTDENDQKNSLAAQKLFFQRYFHSHRNWNNVGIFADEGLSGTSLEKRDDFQRMLRLARKGEIDIILTKEVSRFSRNVQHLLNIVEELRSIEVYVWFLSDDINTESNDYRERLTQVATNAEQESLRTSRRVKWGQQQQMELGVVFGRREMYGYKIVKDERGLQHFELIPQEAAIVRQIFEWFSAGEGTYRISQRLEQMGIKPKQYSHGWTPLVILRILRNEKYVGDLVQGKTYTPDPLTHKKKYNKGEARKVYIRDHHPESAIVDRELWDKVQAILKEKAPSPKVRTKHSGRYWTSGKVFCGLCTQRYISYTKKLEYGTYRAWVCFENHRHGSYKEILLDTGETVTAGCNASRVNHRVLITAVHDIIADYLTPHKENLLQSLYAEIKTFSPPEDRSRKINLLEKAIIRKREQLTKLTQGWMEGTVPLHAYQATIPLVNEELEELLQGLKKVQTLVEAEGTDADVGYMAVAEQLREILSLSADHRNDGFYERITKQILVYPSHLLKLCLSFLPFPVYMQYRAAGRKEFYRVEFTILTEEQFVREVSKYSHIEHEDCRQHG